MHRAEAALLALAARAGPHVDEVTRNHLAFADFVRSPGSGATVEDGEARLTAEEVSPVRRHWRRDAAIAVAVAGREMSAARADLATRLTAIAGAIMAEPTLGGAVDTLRLDGPLDTDETRLMGGAAIAAQALIVSLFYSTGENPLEDIG